MCFNNFVKLENSIDVELNRSFFDFTNELNWEVAFKAGFKIVSRPNHERFVQAGIAPGIAIPIDLFCDMPRVRFAVEQRRDALPYDRLRPLDNFHDELDVQYSRTLHGESLASTLRRFNKANRKSDRGKVWSWWFLVSVTVNVLAIRST